MDSTKYPKAKAKMNSIIDQYPIISVLATYISKDDFINLSLTCKSAQNALYKNSIEHCENLYARAVPSTCSFINSGKGYHRFSVPLKQLEARSCVRCFKTVCKGCVFDTSLHKRLSNWMRGCTLKKRLRKVCVPCENCRLVKREKICKCDRGGLWICGNCSDSVEIGDELIRREEQEHEREEMMAKMAGTVCAGNDLKCQEPKHGEKEEVKQGEVQYHEEEKGSMVVICNWCDGLASREVQSF
ncbi:hypothetical protein L873DRAFT_1276406 [Choiromyces venosus 120613-1]|uniref:Uncharacterized protein n=1 Tax=Choiromyces venosus 120613-1 TaxID=1336337 RepID=A0A3N4KFH3_9PEZI|nr:hypothetical protein L873DRAFT_1276406 [Choiromyces venosus 120613-1]